MEGIRMSDVIKAVIFDQGGVLSKGGGKGTNEEAASRVMGLSSTIVVPDLVEDLKRGVIDNAEYVEAINRRYPNAPVKLSDKMWDDVYASLRPEPLSYELVRQCQESGRRVGLLSNINPATAKRFQEDGSYDGFDPLVLSCFVHCAKPDPAIYAVVEAALPDIKPGEIILLDDQDKCVRGARKRGWQAMHVTNLQQMAQDLSRLLHLG
jgi:epoxide hydrolase-like predicted phosphatase